MANSVKEKIKQYYDNVRRSMGK